MEPRPRRWKVALSVAVVAAIAVPALAGTWRLAPGGWMDLTDSQKRNFSMEILSTNDCTIPNDPNDKYELFFCKQNREVLRDGGYRAEPERWTPRKIATNLFVAAAAFALTFALVMIGPPIGRRYLGWLRR